MKMGDGGFRPAYNGQYATDTKSQVIVGEEVTVGSDMGQLAPMVEQVSERCGEHPDQWLGDRGYPAHEQLDTVAEKTLVYAPVPKPKDEATDPHAPEPGDSEAVDAWRKRMGTEEAKMLYKDRAATAECVTEQELRGLFELQRDLHDDLLQTLYAVRLGLENIKQIIRKRPDNVDSLLSDVLQSLSAVMNRVRHYTKTPIPSLNVVDRFRTTLQSLIPVGDDSAPELMIDIQSDVAEGLSEVQAEYLLRIAQEAVSNSLRHANAKAIRVLLWKEHGNLQLSIEDDGQGFDVKQRKTAAAGQGLKNLATRASIIGGCLNLRSRSGEGTEVTVNLRINTLC